METDPTADPPVLGFDTGFFVRLLQADARAVAAWADIREGRAIGTASCITLFELESLGLRGQIERQRAETLVAALPNTCRMVWLGEADGAARFHRAVRLGHDYGLAMADAIILSSLLDAGATTVYTTDSDFERYDGPSSIVQL